MSDAAFSASPVTQRATLCYGVRVEQNSFVGKTVGELRTKYASAWKIPSDAKAYKGKTQLDENYSLQPGDKVEFFRRSGEKG